MSYTDLDLRNPSGGGAWTAAQLFAYTNQWPQIAATWPVGLRVYATDLKTWFIWNGSNWLSSNYLQRPSSWPASATRSRSRTSSP